jgi:hypothetical protein
MIQEDLPEYIKQIIAEAKEVLYTGSKYICPTEPYNDIDIMVLVDNIEKWEAEHTVDSKCGADVTYPDDDMVAFRIGEFNILITAKPDYFIKWQFATQIAIKLNLVKKEDRKYLFKAFLDNDGVKIEHL